jgi:amino-acid N-acetyltransferase
VSTEIFRQQPPLSAVVGLLKSVNLPASDLTDEHLVHFFYAGTEVDPTGLVGLELCGENALLRSLVVTPGGRSKGLGSALVTRAEGYARQHRARSIYLLTTTAEAFFKRRGYVAVLRESAPVEIKATREFSDICPASSAFLTKSL